MEASLMMTPRGRNKKLKELFYNVVFEGYLSIPYLKISYTAF